MLTLLGCCKSASAITTRCSISRVGASRLGAPARRSMCTCRGVLALPVQGAHVDKGRAEEAQGAGGAEAEGCVEARRRISAQMSRVLMPASGASTNDMAPDHEAVLWQEQQARRRSIRESA